jgi:5-methyltetrahydrofolate--homocysteine methyltransferase
VHDIGKNIVGVVLGCNNYRVIDMGVMVPSEKILRTAREERVDIVGLSGLITPSLDELVHVAKELEREGFTVPLLIGGATTSKIHTAVKIAPSYSPPVVHVLDASRAVGVAGSLVNPELREEFASQNRREQDASRRSHLERESGRTLLSLSQARARRAPLDWSDGRIARPSFLGLRTLNRFPLEKIVPYIDWTPFFHAWELRGRYPQILEDPEVGPRARELFEDGKRLLDRIVARKELTARGVYGFFPANSEGDDIEVYTDDTRLKVLAVFHTLRQQAEKTAGEHNYALSDFVAPKSTRIADFIGGFAVSTGFGVEELSERFLKDHDDYNSILTKALADRLAEAFAELVHQKAREDWGYGVGENLSIEDLIRERYRGIRPAPGYPACPDHTEKKTLFELLQAEKSAGIRLTESFAMDPASSVSGLYFAHPEARYFSVGKIGRDQLLDYRERKGMDLATLERWLAPNL